MSNNLDKWLEDNYDEENEKAFKKQFLEESFEYLRSDEAKEVYKNNMLSQIALYLSHKFDCSVTVENDVISTEGLKEEDKVEYLETLSDLGML